MVDSYLSPQVISFINYFYYFTKRIDKNISMCVSIIDSMEIQIRLRKGNYNICQCYMSSFIDHHLLSIECISEEVHKIVMKLLDEERVGTHGKVET